MGSRRHAGFVAVRVFRASMHSDEVPVIRVAGRGDEEMLLRWRNDPSARLWFTDLDPVPRKSHREWLLRQLEHQPICMWIAQRGDLPVGCVRLDMGDRSRGRVSVVVASHARGTGVGTCLISWVDQKAVALGCVEVFAEVHPGNIASTSLFTAAGYRPSGTSDAGFVLYVKRLRPEE